MIEDHPTLWTEATDDDGRVYWTPMVEVTGPTWRRVLGAGEVHAVMPDRA